ncbi:hypothetical protein [Nocardia jinanensis]|uniref:Alpha/beta hydrolase n=1 Tax=Nocardia jinanensis TaxID=382504 RepID=A0A917RKM1_9NOCA|nr:hypothetical protein [Nocardia jinanensis]GGL12333.1 hypothetical protein GCM10011588_28430 [Nocardia jinanensis]
MIFPRRLWQLLVVTAMAIPAGAVAPMAGAVPTSGAQCEEADCSDADALRRSERPYFPKADLATYVLPRAGHSMNLALNGPEFLQRATQWVDGIAAR